MESMITEVYHITTVGLTYLTLPELANVTILTVAREGRIYTEVTGTPTGMEFKYTSTGRIDFDENAPFESYEALTGVSIYDKTEIIYIKYKV